VSAAEVLVRKLLELAGGSPTSGWTLALAGPGLEELPDRIDMAQGSVSIARPTTEVELRHMLWRANGAPVLAIVPTDLAGRLPPDLVRPARGGRVHALDVGDVLSVVLGSPVTGVDDIETRQLALANLEALQSAVSSRTLPTVIDRRTLDELLLDVTVGRRIRTDRPGVLLAEWVRTPPSWAPEVQRLVERSLPTLHATEGALLAWALDAGLLRAVVLHGVLLAIDAELAPDVWGPLAASQRSPRLRDLGEEVLRRSFAELAQQALAVLPPADAGPILAEAGRIANRVMPKSDVAKSALLPLGLELLCHGIAHAASQGKSVSAADVQRMRGHRAAELYRADVELLEPMARLARWVATADTDPGRDVVEHVRRYQRDGAFADVAAAQVRRAISKALRYETEARKLLVLWEQRRNAGNRAFAELLAGGYVQALHAPGLVGVHNLWQEHVSSEMKRADSVRDASPRGDATALGGAYLVVLDGCSYPVFLELLEELASNAGAPIGLRGGSDGARGAPATSILPSITSHARGAIFLGQIPKDPWLSEATFRDGERTTDPGRFRQNPKLGGPDGEARKLFLKGDIAGGAAPLFAAIENRDLRVVAAVFNAIDDQIGSTNTGAMVAIRAGDITGLVPSIQRALKAQRAVVVTADHGHTPYLGPDHKVGVGEAPRFTELKAGDSVPEGFIEIDLNGLGGAKERRAFGWKLGAYLGLPQVGFHGGCALEEMVVPLATLVPDGVPADRPLWWDDAGERVERSSAQSFHLPEPKKKPGAGQLGLFSRPAQSSLDESISGALDEDERLALEVLGTVGAARQQQLAERLRRPVGRIGGFMTTLQRKLRGLGVELFRAERLPSGEWNYTWTGPRSGA
jgi:hypothetical protein